MNPDTTVDDGDRESRPSVRAKSRKGNRPFEEENLRTEFDVEKIPSLRATVGPRRRAVSLDSVNRIHSRPVDLKRVRRRAKKPAELTVAAIRDIEKASRSQRKRMEIVQETLAHKDMSM